MAVLDAIQIKAAIDYDNQHATDMLERLNAHFGLPDSEGFTEGLVKAISDFQTELGLDDDAKIGKDTRPVLDELVSPAAGALWPAREASVQQRHAHYASLCRRWGHELSSERATLIGLRGVGLFASRTHYTVSARIYDDTFVLLTNDGDVKEFAGATHPFQTDSSASPDFDGDRRGDVGMIRPGLYHCEPTHHHRTGHPALLVKTIDGSTHIPAYRDLNHDGIFTPEEMRHSTTPPPSSNSNRQVDNAIGAYATDILFHPGDPSYSSIGCQTADSANIKLLHGKAPLDYLLILATDLLARLSPLAPEPNV